MKKQVLTLLSFFMILSYGICYGELSKKEQKQIEKAAKAEAKKYAADNWMVSAGALPIQMQLEKAYTMRSEKALDGENLYVMGEGVSVGATYDAAKRQAIEMAKQVIVTQLQTEIATLVETSVSNDQLNSEEAESISRMVSESSSFSKMNLGRLVPVTEIYRDIKGTKSKEVLVMVACNYNAAMKAAKSVIRKDLEERGDKVRDKLDQLLKD